MIRRPPRSTQSRSSAASDVYKRQGVRGRRALGHAGRLLDQLRRRRRLGDEGEGAVLVDRDLHRDDVAALRLRRGVVGPAELHDVHTVLTERRTDRRRRGCGAGVDLELDQGGDLLLGRHVGSLPVTAYGCGSQAAPAMTSAQILATWLNDSSTGVSRPKIETSTFSFCPSALISEIVAGSVSNGPSVTVTDSPTVKSTAIGAAAEALAGAAAGAMLGASMEKTSSRVSGTGWCVCCLL